MDLSLPRRFGAVNFIGSGVVVLPLSKFLASGRVEPIVLIVAILAHLAFNHQGSPFIISAESCSFAKEVLPLAGFHFTSL
jgi:hypothetical protein